MEKEYIKIASLPDGEEIVSTTTFGGRFYWNFKFPFRHYREPKYFVATRNAIYTVEIINK
jgi:hypothetical protein